MDFDSERAGDLRAISRRARRRLLRMHFESGIGHLGGNLSSLDAMLTLYHRVKRPEDAFVLSKGHSAGALYTTLWSVGELEESALATFHRDGTLLAGHPIPGWSAHIPVTTGSLGHGFPVALGMALGLRQQGKPGHVYCLTSDGEWQEGAMWEALIFFAHWKPGNLTVLVDMNGLQGFGTTRQVAGLDGLAAPLRGFGVPVIEIDGHDHEQIERALVDHAGSVILLRTVKGKGVSFMENRMEWHYLPLDPQQYAAAVAELDDSR